MQLELKGINLRVGPETYLYALDLRLQPGSINVLLGPTRAGKTSLARVIAGLDRPTEGQVLVDGRDVTGVSVRKRNLAMVYQQFINYPSLTVFENIASPLRVAGGHAEQAIRAKVDAVAKKLHIDHLLDRLPAELSGGQQQRTAIARALVREVDLLLLDEPLVNLDYKLREELRAELRELFAASRTTVVYATTEPQEALILGGHTAVLDAGRVLQFAPTGDVFHHPAWVRVAEIFSDPPMNLFNVNIEVGPTRQARVSADVALPLGSHLEQVPIGACRIGVRPNHVRIVPQSADHGIPVVAELAEISGSNTYLHARHGDVGLLAQLAGVHRFDIGQRLALYINPADLFAFDVNGKLLASPERTVAREMTAA